jgi:hypothetical protein
MATGDSSHPGPGAAAAPETVEELTDTDTGRWQITTVTSLYLLDLDQRWALRIPGGSGVDHGLDRHTGLRYEIRRFDEDHRRLSLYRIVKCVPGERMYLWIDADEDTVFRIISTPVQEIRRLLPRLATDTSPGSRP